MNHLSNNDQSQAFHEYILNRLENTSDYRARLEIRNQQAINFFLVMLTALGGGGIVIYTKNAIDPISKLLLLGLVLLVMAGFGFLTFMWILTSGAEGIRMVYIQFFLHKYFRDMDLNSFNKYGLSSKLTHWYWWDFDNNYRPDLPPANKITLLVLAGITDIMFAFAVGICVYAETSKLPSIANIIIAVGAGVGVAVAYAMSTKGRWKAAFQEIANLHDEMLTIIKDYHSENPVTKNAQHKGH